MVRHLRAALAAIFFATALVTGAPEFAAPSPARAAAPEWVGTAVMTYTWEYVDGTTRQSRVHSTSYTLAPDALDTDQTAWSGAYSSIEERGSEEDCTYHKSTRTASGEGTGLPLLVEFWAGDAFHDPGYQLGVTEIAMMPAVQQDEGLTWVGGAGGECVATDYYNEYEIRTQPGLAVIPSATDDKYVLQGRYETRLNEWATEEVAYRVRRADCTGAPDSDGDGLDVCEEFDLGLDPTDSDSDDDGLNDGDEVAVGSDPHDAHSDDDGLDDGTEYHVSDTSPSFGDTDSDAIGDYTETDGGLYIDTDLDGYVDGRDEDSDDDGLLDSTEGTADSDGDGIADWRDPVATVVDESFVAEVSYSYVGARGALAPGDLGGYYQGGEIVTMGGDGAALVTHVCFVSSWTAEVHKILDSTRLLWNGQPALYLAGTTPNQLDDSGWTDYWSGSKNVPKLEQAVWLKFCAEPVPTSVGYRAAYPLDMHVETLSGRLAEVEHSLYVEFWGPGGLLTTHELPESETTNGAVLLAYWSESDDIEYPSPE